LLSFAWISAPTLYKYLTTSIFPSIDAACKLVLPLSTTQYRRYSYIWSSNKLRYWLIWNIFLYYIYNNVSFDYYL
jgi:hypothetical protein